MAEADKSYLNNCRDANRCPTCQGPLTTRVGTGSFKDGVFCSLECQAKWHSPAMQLRHLERLRKAKADD